MIWNILNFKIQSLTLKMTSIILDINQSYSLDLYFKKLLEPEPEETNSIF